MLIDLLQYPRPVLTEEQQRAMAHLAVDLTAHKNTADIRKAVAALLCENMRLTLEVNQHRAARGMFALPTVEQK